MRPLLHSVLLAPRTRATTTSLRSLCSQRKKPFELPPGSLLNTNNPIDEEKHPSYDSKSFYPAKPGEVLADRYQILVKVGWGGSSTVWFARDMRGHSEEPEGAVALKINNADAFNTVNYERETEEHVATADPSHHGQAMFRTASECFEIAGPEGGRHVCLAYEPMREPLWLFKQRFVNGMIPLPLVKLYIFFFLTALDYLHRVCKVVHTDLKPENIMFSFEDPDVFNEFMNSQLENPMQYKIDSAGRAVYRCHNNFGDLRDTFARAIPQIVDLGSSDRLHDEGIYGCLPIQPNHYRAPEVILGCGWRMSADIWNLGTLLWDIIRGDELFQQAHTPDGKYSAASHLAEMIALLGPPPPKLVARAKSALGKEWPSPLSSTMGGKCYRNNNEFFGGPFFDENGTFLYNHLIPQRTLEDTVPSVLEGDQKEEFLSFARAMLTWLPEERKTAGELIEHPFLAEIVSSAKRF